MQFDTNTSMVGIVTRYLGPTNFKGSRIVATACGYRVVVDIDHKKTTLENHAAAAHKLAEKLGWTKYHANRSMHSCSIDDGRATVWAFSPTA